ncbi:MAG: hypothetical protein WC972_14280, partial [Trueperaceae bacterium]
RRITAAAGGAVLLVASALGAVFVASDTPDEAPVLGLLATTAQGQDELRVTFDDVGEAVQRDEGGHGIGAPTVFLRDFPGTEIPPTTVQHTMAGQLGPELMTHVVTDARDLAYTARNHAMSHPYPDGGFQIIDQVIGEFTFGGDAEFSVDISTAGVTGRTWPLFWFIPEGALSTPLPSDPAFIDTVRDHPRTLTVPTDYLFFKPERFNGHVGWGGYHPAGRFGAYWEPIQVDEDFIVRTPHRIVFSGRDVSVYVGDHLQWAERGVVPASWEGRRIQVRLDFVNYNSPKEHADFGCPVAEWICIRGTTWHWDNVLLRADEVFPVAEQPTAPTPTATVTATATVVPTATATATPSTATPTATATVEPTSSATPTPSTGAPVTPAALRALADWLETTGP